MGLDDTLRQMDRKDRATAWKDGLMLGLGCGMVLGSCVATIVWLTLSRIYP